MLDPSASTALRILAWTSLSTVMANLIAGLPLGIGKPYHHGGMVSSRELAPHGPPEHRGPKGSVWRHLVIEPSECARRSAPIPLGHRSGQSRRWREGRRSKGSIAPAIGPACWGRDR